jgi:hypothetical protein
MKRWEFVYAPPPNGLGYCMKPDELGSYVIYSDHLKEVEVLRETLKKCRDELVAADRFVPSESWQYGIREAVEKAEKLLGTFDPTS